MNDNPAETWMKASAETASNKDLDAHLNLISKNVSLTGVEGFDSINYEAWAAQCKHEFENDLIRNVMYEGLKVLAATETKVMFKTLETVEGSDGTVNRQGIEALIEKEEDGVWRLIQERVLPEDESRHDGLL